MPPLLSSVAPSAYNHRGFPLIDEVRPAPEIVATLFTELLSLVRSLGARLSTDAMCCSR